MKSLITKNKLLLILSFFFLVRVIYSYFFGYREIPPVTSDGISYNSYALAILNQSDWLTNPSFLGHYRPPVYPVFLAIIYSIFGSENFFAVYFIQSIIGVLTVYYIFKLSACVFDEKKSFLALFWAGFNVYYIWYTGMVLRETLIFFLIIFSFYHLWVFFEKKEHANLNKRWSLRHNLIGILFYGTLIPFLFYGLFYLFKIKNKAVWFLVFPIVVQAILHFLMWGRERYRNHIVAFIIILGCYGMITAYDFITKKEGSLVNN